MESEAVNYLYFEVDAGLVNFDGGSAVLYARLWSFFQKLKLFRIIVPWSSE